LITSLSAMPNMINRRFMKRDSYSETCLIHARVNIPVYCAKRN
jgi:hypothetical protein